METSLYLVSNVIRIYAISIFLDSFFGNLKCKRIIKIIAYISYYFIGSLVWIISQNTNINLVINTAKNHLNFYSIPCNLEEKSFFCNMGLCGWNVYRLDCVFYFR